MLQVQALKITPWETHINNSHEVSVKGDSAERCDSNLLVLALFAVAQVVIKMTVKCQWAVCVCEATV